MRSLKRAKNMSIIIFCILLVCTSLGACGKPKEVLADKKDEVVVTIDDTEITLGDMAYYIYSVESLVQVQAYEYNASDPNQYWNLHTNGIFIKLFAKEMCLNTAVRDFILEAEAKSAGIKMSDETTETTKSFAKETYTNMDSEIVNILGLTQDMMIETMLRSQLASLYAQSLVEMKDLEQDDINIEGIYYNSLRDSHIIEVNEEVWEELEFGSITVNYK